MNIIRLTVAAALIISAGLAHGAWTSRWGVSSSMATLVSRFDSVPMVIGDWKATALEMDPRIKTKAGAEAGLNRVYTNPSRGVSVTVMLLGGLPSDIGSHTPDVCYTGAGFGLTSPVPYVFRSGPNAPRAEFRTALAVRTGSNPSSLRLFWGWNDARGWQAPPHPRWTFASAPALCKLYVIRETGGADVKPGEDPCNEFLGVFLPELQRALFSEPK